MPKESKVFDVFGSFDANGIVYHRESFGWELNSVADSKIAMHRETTIPNYYKLTQYERDYDSNRQLYLQYRIKTEVNVLMAFLLLLIFVVPGALYIWYKVNAKNKAAFHLSEMERIVSEARVLRYSEGDQVVS